MEHTPSLTTEQLTGCARVAAEAMSRLEAESDWLGEVSPKDRSLLQDIMQQGVVSFCQWILRPVPRAEMLNIFSTTPARLANTVTLRQSLAIIKVGVETVENSLSDLSLPGSPTDIAHEAVRYSRDVGFALAEAYARAAEVRGAWDARLEALFIDALLREGAGETVDSIAAALGWRDDTHYVVIASRATPRTRDAGLHTLRRLAQASGCEIYLGLSDNILITVLGSRQSPLDASDALTEHMAGGPVVRSHESSSLAAAGPLARMTREAYTVAHAWPDAPRPTTASELLPERVVAGHLSAHTELIESVYKPLLDDATMHDTLRTYLAAGRSLEATARSLFVHPNTVRYRLKKVYDATAWDPMTPRDSYVLQLALTLGSLSHQDL